MESIPFTVLIFTKLTNARRHCVELAYYEFFCSAHWGRPGGGGHTRVTLRAPYLLHCLSYRLCPALQSSLRGCVLMAFFSSSRYTPDLCPELNADRFLSHLSPNHYSIIFLPLHATCWATSQRRSTNTTKTKSVKKHPHFISASCTKHCLSQRVLLPLSELTPGHVASRHGVSGRVTTNYMVSKRPCCPAACNIWAPHWAKCRETLHSQFLLKSVSQIQVSLKLYKINLLKPSGNFTYHQV
jgi:hypothetical protein